MNTASKTCLVLAVAALAAFGSGSAFARQGRGADDVVAPSASPVAGTALSIRLREKSNGRFEFRMTLENAPSGLSPQVFVADASGTLTLVGPMTADNHTVGEYKLRLRSQKGAALPVGATSISELGGRAYEIRDGGVAILSGTLPTVAAKSGTSGGGHGADDAAGHVSGGHGADDAAGHVSGGHGADDATR